MWRPRALRGRHIFLAFWSLPLRVAALLAALGMMLTPIASRAEDGSKLWLRYARGEAGGAGESAGSIGRVVVIGQSPTLDVIRTDVKTALEGLTGHPPDFADAPNRDGGILIGTPTSSPAIASLPWRRELEALGREGFIIRATDVGGHRTTVIASPSEIGALYGTFHCLRLLQTTGITEKIDIVQRPRVHLRLLNHWDNLDGSIERGYAGRSLWKWDELPSKIDPRYIAYARANASIGINGAVLNNVNAKPLSLSHEYLAKAAALADVFRPYGVRVYLSANFAAPRTLGKLPTADPLDPQVAAWWRAKADEIYQLIPDFGGFVVKANSEGQPGPQEYRRTHADGANVLAEAVAPHGGVVMWRAFVYNQDVDADRIKRAYKEFTPLDGKFRDNVIVQVKNGPLDFQPREPFHPLFGAMTRTPVMAELQITQEYLGHSKHLVYLAPMWKEFLDADTFCRGPGSTVAKAIDGSLFPDRITGIAGVANTGSEANWTGHDFAQANWYAFGRLAWDPNLSAEQIADEWLAQTFSTDAATRQKLRGMMLGSWDALIGYSMPLGLHHLIAGDHYAPAPWNAREPRDDWTAVYYHHADEQGIGFDRTRRGSGSRAVEQYFPPLRDQFDDPATCPQKSLLWFHHVRWDQTMRSGRTLWDELCFTYNDGVCRAEAMQETWRSAAPQIDPQRHQAVTRRLEIQVTDARKWRDDCLRYFQQFSKRPITSQSSPAPSK